jgi:FAD/FMN-containing dehydrogenase
MSLYSRLKDSLPELGRLSSIPAGMIDRAYRDEPATGYFGKLRSFITIRAIYVFLFIPSLFIDMIASLVASIRYAFGVLFRSDHVQQERISQLQKYSTQFSRSLYALLGFVFGLFSPKLVAFYFTPEKPNAQGVTAGGHYHHDQNAELVQPESIEELQNIIKNAAQGGKKVIPIGAGFSQGKQFLPEHGSAIVVDLSQLNTVEINTNDKTALVGAGACWFKIQEKADEFKLALQVMQASNVFSVGGSIGTNIHGWDHQSGVLSNTIESIQIVNAQGELQILTPSDPLFNAIMGGFGLCGIVVRATIKLTDNLKLKEVGTFIPVTNYAQYFREQVIHDKTAKMHLFRLSLHPNHLLEEGVAVSYVAQDNTPVVTPNLITKELQQGTRFERVMVNLARRINWLRGLYWTGERDRLLRNDEHPIMTTNEVMQPPINAMLNPSVSEAEWLQEYYLPGDRLDDFLKRLGQLLMKNKVSLLNASVRFVKQHQGALSYCDDGDKFAVVLCFNQSLRESKIIESKKWLREAQQMAIQHGGTYYLPYQHVSSPDDFKKAYPRAEAFDAIKKEVDPDTRFISGFYQKYLAKTQRYSQIILKQQWLMKS